MLPLKITLEGFMSYRDATTLDFAGASLWMLAGQNGAGKSSVFDAMRWVLFNAHRGGKTGFEALIHHDRDKLRVSFDIELSEGRFRLIRTLARQGRSTWQIEKLVDGTTEKVPETDMRDGYNHWLSDHLGISDETFCTAFYLAQGRGDAILSADHAQRFALLAEMVDLSAFESLHERAKIKADELESQVRFQKLQFDAAPPADEARITELAAHLDELTARMAHSQTHITELQHLEPWALQWQDLIRQYEVTGRELETTRQMAVEAPLVEGKLALLKWLEKSLPTVGRWLQTQSSARQNASARSETRQKIEHWKKQNESSNVQLQTSKTQLSRLETERQDAQNARSEALIQLNVLAPQRADIARLAEARRELGELGHQLSSFPSDLESQIEALETRIKVAHSQIAAAKVLGRFVSSRDEWQRANGELEQAQNAITHAEAELPLARREPGRQADALKAASQRLGLAVESLAATQTREGDSLGALQRFEEVKGESNCHFCGQLLTPEHAHREQERLEKALEAARMLRKTAHEAHELARATWESASVAQEDAQLRVQNAERALREMQHSLIDTQKTLLNAQKTAQAALQELEMEFASGFDGINSRDWNESRVLSALDGPFPTRQELAELKGGAELLPVWEKEKQAAIENAGQRLKLAARFEATQSQIAPLSARFDEETIARIEDAQNAHEASLQSANRVLSEGEPAFKAAREAVEQAEKRVSQVRYELAEYEKQLARLEATSKAIEADLRSQVENVDLELRPILERDEESLRTDFEAWNDERNQLKRDNWRSRALELEKTRGRVTELEIAVAQLEKTLAHVPEAARRAPDELKSEIEQRHVSLSENDSHWRACELEKAALERAREQKNQLAATLLEVENRARQHQTLADLLGPRQLQRHLLREAENGIIDEANAVLDRISSGSLRLELRAEDDEVAGARKGTPKVLDVAVFHAAGAQRGQAMLPIFLSGSQRFRVAVAMALGMGRYATRGAGHARLEAVIIDEGFGSLDKVGRGEMIDELKALGEELRRVILVSHQDEFAEAFPHRYLIEHDGRASTARLVAQ